MKINLKKPWPIILLAVFTCLYFFNIIIAKNFLWEDFPIYYFPAKLYVFQSLQSWQIPLWNPNLNLGYPIIADTTAAIFYPLNWLVIPFIGENTTINYWLIELWAIFHLFIAGVFMYYLVDYLTKKYNKIISSKIKFSNTTINFAALFSAIAFMFSGFFIGHLKHVGQITTATWMPLIFLFLHKSFKEKKHKYAIYAGIFWAISILSGHLQIVYHFSLWFGLFILWEIINSFINKKNYKKIIISSLIAIIITFSISAIHLLPFLEFLDNSTRNQVSENFASSFSLSPTEFLTNLFAPHTFGEFKQHSFYWGQGGFSWETSIYMGIITLILALIAVIKKICTNNFIFFLLFSSLIFTGLAFGQYSIVHPILSNIIPGINMIRAPSRFILPVIFSLCMLAGFGFNYLVKFLKTINEKQTEHQIKHNIIKILKIFTLAIFGFLLFLYTQKKQIYKPEPLLNNLIALGLIIESILILIYLQLKKNINQNIFIYILVIILFVDLFIFGWQFNNGDIKPKEYYPQNQTTKFIQNLPNSPRIINDDYLMPNSAYFYNFEILGSNHYMMIQDYYDFTDGLSENLYYYGKHRDFTNFFDEQTKLNLIGIKYIISERDMSKWFKKINKNIYKNNKIYPRFILSKKAIIEKNPNKILQLLNKNYNPNENIYINEEYKNNINNNTKNTSEINNIKIIKNESDYIKLEIKNNNSKWLLANEIYYPGWQAKIDGKITKIHKANYTFRAIPVSTGKHIIEFTFKPKSYLYGKIISLLSLFILAIFLFTRKKI